MKWKAYSWDRIDPYKGFAEGKVSSEKFQCPIFLSETIASHGNFQNPNCSVELVNFSGLVIVFYRFGHRTFRAEYGQSTHGTFGTSRRFDEWHVSGDLRHRLAPYFDNYSTFKTHFLVSLVRSFANVIAVILGGLTG